MKRVTQVTPTTVPLVIGKASFAFNRTISTQGFSFLRCSTPTHRRQKINMFSFVIEQGLLNRRSLQTTVPPPLLITPWPVTPRNSIRTGVVKSTAKSPHKLLVCRGSYAFYFLIPCSLLLSQPHCVIIYFTSIHYYMSL